MGERISGCLYFDQTVAAKQAKRRDWWWSQSRGRPGCPGRSRQPGPARASILHRGVTQGTCPVPGHPGRTLGNMASAEGALGWEGCGGLDGLPKLQPQCLHVSLRGPWNCGFLEDAWMTAGSPPRQTTWRQARGVAMMGAGSPPWQTTRCQARGAAMTGKVAEVSRR